MVLLFTERTKDNKPYQGATFPKNPDKSRSTPGLIQHSNIYCAAVLVPFYKSCLCFWTKWMCIQTHKLIAKPPCHELQSDISSRKRRREHRSKSGCSIIVIELFCSCCLHSHFASSSKLNSVWKQIWVWYSNWTFLISLLAFPPLHHHQNLNQYTSIYGDTRQTLLFKSMSYFLHAKLLF